MRWSTGWLLLFFFFFPLLDSASAQSPAEIVRRERERRANQPQRSAHVYTNEDLARPKILQPEDTPSENPPRAEEPSRSATTPAPEPIVPNPGVIRWPSSTPLGDVARYYRRAKQREENPEVARTRPRPASSLSSRMPKTSPSTAKLPPPLTRWETPVPARKTPPVPVKQNPPEPLPADGWVQVNRGDSLWKLAGRYLGNGKEWPAMAAANPELRDPNLIRPGQKLRLPTLPEERGAKQFRVKAGDSLWKLAAAQLGSGQEWTCLAAANPQLQDANRIYPGQLLTVPDRCLTWN